MWTGSWSNPEALHAISESALLGYDMIEIPLGDPFNFDIEFHRNLLKKYNITPSFGTGLGLT